MKRLEVCTGFEGRESPRGEMPSVSLVASMLLLFSPSNLVFVVPCVIITNLAALFVDAPTATAQNVVLTVIISIVIPTLYKITDIVWDRKKKRDAEKQRQLEQHLSSSDKVSEITVAERRRIDERSDRLLQLEQQIYEKQIADLKENCRQLDLRNTARKTYARSLEARIAMLESKLSCQPGDALKPFVPQDFGDDD